MLTLKSLSRKFLAAELEYELSRRSQMRSSYAPCLKPKTISSPLVRIGRRMSLGSLTINSMSSSSEAMPRRSLYAFELGLRHANISSTEVSLLNSRISFSDSWSLKKSRNSYSESDSLRARRAFWHVLQRDQQKNFNSADNFYSS